MSLRLTGGRVLLPEGELAQVDVVTHHDRVVHLGSGGPAAERTIDVGGRVVMPGFVDAHTHLCWAGSRLDEWDLQRAGTPYLRILASGGGILSTVRAVRAASVDDLARALRRRLDHALRHGTTTVEVKSGYGLDTVNELKMLHAISRASDGFAGTVVPTALLGHALDPDQPHHVDTVIHETLPAVHGAFPGIAVDAYIEQGAWSLEDGLRFFRAAQDLGHPVRVHADQFHALGMVEAAVELGALSVDHLEATGPEALRHLAASRTFGVVLPVSGFHTDGRYADARTFLDAGGRLVLATNANPGSAPSVSMPLVVALAVRQLGLTPHEALTAITSTAANLLGMDDRGRLAVGCRADLVVLCHDDPRALAHELGGNPVDRVICGGALVPPTSLT